MGHSRSWLVTGILFPKPWLWELAEDRLVILNLALHILLPCYAWPTPFPDLTNSIFQTQWESAYLLLGKANSSTCQFPHWKHFHHRGLQVTGIPMHPELCREDVQSALNRQYTGAPADRCPIWSRRLQWSALVHPRRHTFLWWCGEVPGSLAGLRRIPSIGLTLVGTERGNSTLWNLAC